MFSSTRNPCSCSSLWRCNPTPPCLSAKSGPSFHLKILFPKWLFRSRQVSVGVESQRFVFVPFSGVSDALRPCRLVSLPPCRRAAHTTSTNNSNSAIAFQGHPLKHFSNQPLLVQGNDLAGITQQFAKITSITSITRTAQKREPLLYSTLR